MLNLNHKQIVFFLLVALGISCKEKPHLQLQKKEESIINCYIIKPVKNDSKADSLRNFEFTNESLNDFLSNVISGKRHTEYDSTMDYITSFERQKMILVNDECFEKLSQPDSCNLMDIFLNSGFRTRAFTRSIVEFIQLYKKNIFQFGSATVFEYRFNGVAENEPHFMYIILKDLTEDSRRRGNDYKGFVICSDGLDWKDYKEKEFSVPLFTQMVRRRKEFYIPLLYKEERFIPIGHFKSNNWQE